MSIRDLENARSPAELLDSACRLGLEDALSQPLEALKAYAAHVHLGLFDDLLSTLRRGEDEVTIRDALAGAEFPRWLASTRPTGRWALDTHRALLLDACHPEPGPSDGPTPRSADPLRAWAQRHDVLDLLESWTHVSSLDAAHNWAYTAARLRMSELLLRAGPSYDSTVKNAGLYATRRAEARGWAQLEEASHARAERRARETAELAGEIPPSDPGARQLYDWLCAAHAAMRETLPPEIEEPERLFLASVSTAPPTARINVFSSWGHDASLELLLSAEDPRDLKVRCRRCSSISKYSAPCMHAPAACRHLARLLLRDDTRVPVEPLLAALARPAWERFLDEAFAGEPAEIEGAQSSIGFRLKTEREGSRLGLELVSVSTTARGGARLKRLTLEHARGHLEREPGADGLRRALELLSVDFEAQVGDGEGAESSRWNPRASTVHRALLALVGHPQVYAKFDGRDQPIRVEREAPKLRIDRDPDGRTIFKAMLGGEELGFAELSTMLAKGVAGGVLARLDLDARLCTAGEISPAMMRVIQRLELGALRAPPEATEMVLRRVEPLEAGGQIERAEAVKGPRRDANRQLGWRIVPEPDARLIVEVRVRPIAGSASFIAGEGPCEVYGRDENLGIFHVVRDLAGERAEALGLAEHASLVSRDGSPVFALADDAAATFLSWLETHAGDTPVEWERSRWRVTRPPSPRDLWLEIKRSRDWFNVSGHLKVDGVQVDLAMLLEAARKERRFLVAGEGDCWIPLSQEFRERLAALADFASSSKEGLALNPLSVPVVAALKEEARVTAEPAWDALAVRFARADALVPELPSGLRAELRPYQLEGFRWLARLSAWGVGACLADDMGLGKTLQALSIMLARSSEGPTLVVAPTSVCFNWRREAEGFTPTLKVTIYGETPRELREGLIDRQGAGDVLVVSYGLLLQDRDRFTARRWTTLVLDEAQAIKNSETLRAKAVLDVDAEWTLAMSGTPIENHLGELWSLMRRLAPGLLGSQERFRERFALPIERGDARASRALSRLIRPFILRRTKAEVATDLPPRTDVLVEIELDRRHRQLYEDALAAAAAEVASIDMAGTEREQARFRMLAALTRLRLLACHPRLVEPESELGSQKLERLLVLLGMLASEGHQALVFSQFVRHLDIVAEALERLGLSFVRLDGSTSAPERARRVDLFQSRSATVFLLSLKAGGVGLNLTAADYVFHLDPWWNPAVEDQATDRAHRIGQLRPVTVYRLIARDTVESKILELHGEKRELVEALLSGSDTVAKLSLEALADLMRTAASEKVPKNATHLGFGFLAREFEVFLKSEGVKLGIKTKDVRAWTQRAKALARFADGQGMNPRASDIRALCAQFLAQELAATPDSPEALGLVEFAEFVRSSPGLEGTSA